MPGDAAPGPRDACSAPPRVPPAPAPVPLVVLISSAGTMRRHQQDKKVHCWLRKSALYTCTCAPTWPSASSVVELLEGASAGGRPVLASLNGTDRCLGVMRRALCHAPGSYKIRHSRVGAQVLMSCPIASAARRSAVPLPAPGNRPARHKGPRDPA
eukprot:scaffold14497_cov116-Isochrysis_galbana.AAC.7